MYYRRVGDVPPKRHTQHRHASGALHAEEVMGEEGFSSDSSILYHLAIPSAIVDATPWTPGDLDARRRTSRCCRGTSTCTASSPARSGRPPTP